MCVCCIELMTYRKHVCFMEAKLAELEKLRQREGFVQETLSDLGEDPTPVLTARLWKVRVSRLKGVSLRRRM